jgi:hypothetical protein
MKRSTAEKFVMKELIDLSVPVGTMAFNDVYENAVEAAEILTKKELITLIQDQIELLPAYKFFG